MQIREGKIFQGGPNNLEILVRGSKIFRKIEIYYWGSKYFDIFGSGATK